jgi:signal transduction histidine kinase
MGEAQEYNRLESLERRNFWLWGMSAVLLLSLAGTVVCLYMPQVWGGIRVAPPAPETRGALAIGLTGLTLLFSLYAFLRQIQLKRLRNELIEAQIQEGSLRARLLELSSLFDTAGQVQKVEDLEPLLDTIARRVLTCLEADRSTLLLLDPATGELRTGADSGADGTSGPAATVKLGEGLAGWVAANNEPLVLNSDDLVRRFASEVKPGCRITAALCVPLCAKGEVLGVLIVSRIGRDRPFTAGDARLVTLFSEHVAHAVRRVQDDARLQARMAQLAEATADLARRNRVKEFFLEAANEELRGPLSCILAYADFLSHEDAALDPQRRDTFARILRDQAARLEEIVVGSTLLLRLDARRVELERTPSSLNAVMSKSLDAVRDAATVRGVTLLSRLDPELPPVPLDADPLVQGARALLSKAIQLSHPGSTVRVVTRCAGGYAQVEVAGTQVAIAPQDLPKVFDLSAIEDDAAAPAVQSLGLGLHLLKQVVELHGGRVWAETRRDQGSTFHFALPMDAAAGQPAREAGAAAAAATVGAGPSVALSPASTPSSEGNW